MADTKISALPATTTLADTDELVLASAGANKKITGLSFKTAVSDTLKVDKDSVVTAAVRLVQSKLLVGDTQPAFQIRGDGRILWGPGGAGGIDTNLYRLSASTVRTDGQISTQLGYISTSIATGNTLRNFLLAADAQPVFRIDGNGKHEWGQGGSSAIDTTLYRVSPGVIKTDGYLYSGSQIVSAQGTSNQITLGNDGILKFGSALDTNLYRAAADVLKTDDNFWVGTNLALTANSGGLYFGASSDVNLYRAAADVLATDDTFRSYADMHARFGSANQCGFGWVSGETGNGPGMYMGSTADTMIYRVAAKHLRSQTISAEVGAGLPGFAVTQSGDAGYRWNVDSTGKLNWGSGGGTYDAYIYRDGAAVLETNGVMKFGAHSVATQSGASISIGVPYQVGAHTGVGWYLTAGAWDVGPSAAIFAWYPTRMSFELGGGEYMSADSGMLNLKGTTGLTFGAASGEGVGDVNLFRSAANVLKTDDTFEALTVKAGGKQLNPWVQMTQAAYDALTPKDPNTLYVIVG